MKANIHASAQRSTLVAPLSLSLSLSLWNCPIQFDAMFNILYIFRLWLAPACAALVIPAGSNLIFRLDLRRCCLRFTFS